MFKAFVIGILIGVLLVLGGAWLYFTMGWAPVAVTDPPMLMEKKLARAALSARIVSFIHRLWIGWSVAATVETTCREAGLTTSKATRGPAIMRITSFH